ncbi:MAG: hypothetical protein J7507_01330 [Pseudoxanthomonas sp.]|nr:hypothetical protein [Pseudoxanthomonas sp.]
MTRILRHPQAMVSFFRRKKPQDGPAPTTGNRYSAEELAAAFPQAPIAGEKEVDEATGATVVEPAVVDQAPVEAEVEAVIEPAAEGLVDEGVPVQPAAAPGKPGWRERLRNSAL